MFVLCRTFALCPDEFPAELGADHAAACRVFGLDPNSEGYAIHLADTMTGRRTLISRDLGRLRSLAGAAGQASRFLLLSLDETGTTEQPG